MFVEIALKMFFVVLAIIMIFSLVKWIFQSNGRFAMATIILSIILFYMMVIIAAIDNANVTQNNIKNAIEECGTIENIRSLNYSGDVKCINHQVEKDQHIHD